MIDKDVDTYYEVFKVVDGLKIMISKRSFQKYLMLILIWKCPSMLMLILVNVLPEGVMTGP